MNDVIRLRTPHDLVAAVPYLLGYEPQHGQVVTIGVDPTKGTGVGALYWPETERVSDELVRALAGQITGAFEARGPVETYVVLAYGPDAREHAERYSAAVTDLTGRTTLTLAVRDDGGVDKFEPDDLAWLREPDPLTPSTAGLQFVVTGGQAPAASRDDAMAALRPLPAPTWEPPSALVRAQLDALPDVFRARSATKFLERLHDAGAWPDPDDQGRLGYLLHSSLKARDAVLLDAAANRRSDPLIALYRGAPPEYRDATAAAAAAACYLSGRGTYMVTALVQQIDAASPHASLAGMIHAAAQAGINPAAALDVLTDRGTAGPAPQPQSSKDVERSHTPPEPPLSPPSRSEREL